MSGSLISNLQLDLRSDFRLQRYDMFLIKKCVSVNKVSGVGVRGWGQGSGVGVRVRGLGSGSGVKGSGSGVWRQGIWVRVKDVFLISAKKRLGSGSGSGSGLGSGSKKVLVLVSGLGPGSGGKKTLGYRVFANLTWTTCKLKNTISLDSEIYQDFFLSQL